MDTQKVSVCDTNTQATQEFPSRRSQLIVLLRLELGTGPERGCLGGSIKIRRFIERPEVVISHKGPFTSFRDKIHAFDRIWAVAENIAEADDTIYILGLNVRQNHLECFKVGMDVTDQCSTQQLLLMRGIGDARYGFLDRQ